GGVGRARLGVGGAIDPHGPRIPFRWLGQVVGCAQRVLGGTLLRWRLTGGLRCLPVAEGLDAEAGRKVRAVRLFAQVLGTTDDRGLAFLQQPGVHYGLRFRGAHVRGDDRERALRGSLQVLTAHEVRGVRLVVADHGERLLVLRLLALGEFIADLQRLLDAARDRTAPDAGRGVELLLRLLLQERRDATHDTARRLAYRVIRPAFEDRHADFLLLLLGEFGVGVVRVLRPLQLLRVGDEVTLLAIAPRLAP